MLPSPWFSRFWGSLVILYSHVVIHMARPLNDRCHMRTQWIIPVVCFHTLYVAALVGFTGAIRHIEFRFHELKDLWHGILMSTSSIGTYCGYPLSFFCTLWVHIECYMRNWERNMAVLVHCKNLIESKEMVRHIKGVIWSKTHFYGQIFCLRCIYEILVSNLFWNLGAGIMDGK